MSSTELGEMNPVYGPFFGVMGSAAAMVFSALGAAYGTAKSGTGIAAMSVMRPELIMKSIIPVVSSQSLPSVTVLPSVLRYSFRDLTSGQGVKATTLDRR